MNTKLQIRPFYWLKEIASSSDTTVDCRKREPGCQSHTLQHDDCYYSKVI